MADKYEHGSMDVSEREATFAGFIRAGIYIGVFSVGVLIFLALFNS